MKSKASAFLKQIMSVVRSIVKAKSMALKGKTSAIKTRLIILSLLKNKKVQLTAAISHKLHALIGNNNDQDKIINQDAYDDDDDHEDQISNSKAIVVYNYEDENSSASIELVGDDVDDKYPDLTHSLFDSDAEEEEEEESGTSVIDLVRNSKENAQDFSLEDEIDQVADLFIKRFHRRIKLQKLESFKSYQQMLQRGL
ncbi:hypothetical protein Syun_024664 [Stephania yunnanensis]|uniref:Uncharacterized protein n=1 Tax=Stephania yunnanensis TaxID=152371 RepID=A0AAP0NIK5_9MAGN